MNLQRKYRKETEISNLNIMAKSIKPKLSGALPSNSLSSAITEKKSMIKAKNFDEYISNFPVETQEKLKQLRMTIKKAAPDADEVISYGMPGFKLSGMLVWFAGYVSHIGFYPRPSGIEAFKKELSVYKRAK